MTIRTVLVDDENPARDRLRVMLSEFRDVEIVAEARDGEEAVRTIRESRPDLLFLDIEMPGLTGMDVAASLEPPRPAVIFCTAYDRYAIDAFEHHAADYVLKPVTRDRLAKAVDRVRRSLSERRARQSEVREAIRAQTHLLPHAPPALATLDYAGVCRAARGVGGDYYDFLPVEGGRLALAVGDVSGKGLFAGLLMANLQGRIQSLAPRHGDRLEELMAEINALTHASTESNRYATLFYALYDDSSRTLSWVNAGHQPPMLLRPDRSAETGYRVHRLRPSASAVGMLPDARFTKREVLLRPGDVLIAFTDGLVEAVDTEGGEFGEARLEAAVARRGDLGAERLRDEVLAEVDAFRGNRPAHDDVTLVVAKAV